MTRQRSARFLVITGILASLAMAQNGHGTRDKHSILIDPKPIGIFSLNVDIRTRGPNVPSGELSLRSVSDFYRRLQLPGRSDARVFPDLFGKVSEPAVLS